MSNYLPRTPIGGLMQFVAYGAQNVYGDFPRPQTADVQMIMSTNNTTWTQLGYDVVGARGDEQSECYMVRQRLKRFVRGIRRERILGEFREICRTIGRAKLLAAQPHLKMSQCSQHK